MNSSQAGIAHIYGENSELLPASHNEDSLKSETTEIIKNVETLDIWIFSSAASVETKCHDVCIESANENWHVSESEGQTQFSTEEINRRLGQR